MFIPSIYSKVQARVERAAQELILRFAFAGLVLCGDRIEIRVEIVEGLDTLATDGRTIWCNPHYITKVYEKEGLRGVVFRLLHEYFHCFFNHPGRRKHRDHKVWGYAVDVITNRMVCEALTTQYDTWVTPADGVQPSGWERFETVEEVYDHLMKMSSGRPAPTPQYGDTPFTDDLRDPTFADQQEEEEFRDLLTTDILQAAAVVDMLPGKTLPVSITRRLAQIKEGVVPWGRLLTGRMLTDLGDTVATFSPPRKRTYPWLIQPSMKGLVEQILVLFIDGSASVGRHLHREFRAAVKPAVRRAKETHIITFDQVVREHVIIKRVREIDRKLTYTQGSHNYTSVIGAFSLVDKIKPTALACLTDGYIQLPEYKPTYKKTVWCVPRGGKKQPWGTNFIMDVTW